MTGNVQPCKFHSHGLCTCGWECHFAHTLHDPNPNQEPAAAPAAPTAPAAPAGCRRSTCGGPCLGHHHHHHQLHPKSQQQRWQLRILTCSRTCSSSTSMDGKVSQTVKLFIYVRKVAAYSMVSASPLMLCQPRVLSRLPALGVPLALTSQVLSLGALQT